MPNKYLINIIFNRDIKGVSDLYKCMHICKNNIVDNICKRWFEKGDQILLPYEVRNSFIKTNKIVDDINLKYIQFRTLHYRFSINDLFKINIKDGNICSVCNLAVDSNYHKLLNCSKVTALWQEVENWINILGMTDYHLTDRRKIIGDLENSGQINIIILNTKKTIFQSKLDGGEPTLYEVKANVKQCYLHDEYKFTINDH